MVEAHNHKQRQQDHDIYDLAALIATGVNDPKSFPKSVNKFRPTREFVKKDDREMKRQAGIIGNRIPS